mgnify:CR=1 FL=1
MIKTALRTIRMAMIIFKILFCIAVNCVVFTTGLWSFSMLFSRINLIVLLNNSQSKFKQIKSIYVCITSSLRSGFSIRFGMYLRWTLGFNVTFTEAMFWTIKDFNYNE